MPNNLKVWLPVILAVVLIFGIQIGMMLQNSSVKRSIFSAGKTNDLEEVLNYISAKYVDTVNTEKLMQGSIQDMLSRLDPHSIFIPPSRLSEVNEELQGNFEGIGIEFFRINDTLAVVNVIAGGPSEKAGLIKGDRIVSVNDSSITGKNFTDERVIKKLKGKKGSVVKVGIKRKGENGLKYFNITRGTIPFNSINASFMMTKEVGYIKLDRFSSNTYDEFKQAISNLKRLGMTKLIFDLRDNGGGILEQATQILDEFIDKDKLLVYTQGRVYPKVEYKAHLDGAFETGALCILINEGSASASEIVSGALQDWDRATIIGSRSFGKGLVQEQYNLADGAALRLTIAKYYTPSGRCIQRSYNDGVDKYYHDVLSRYSKNNIAEEDSFVYDTTRYYTGEGRVVYGGGGIKPDVFVPRDTTYQSALLSRIDNDGLIPEFSYEYTFAYNNPDVNTIDKTKLAVDFSRFLMKKKITWTDKDWNKSSAHILNEITAFISREESGDNAYYKLIDANDPAIKKALEIVQK